MGACEFWQYEETPNREEAFNEAHRKAAYEHGSGGYTGTLAEKGSCVVLQQTALSMAGATALSEALMDARDKRIDDKWGPAGAIPVGHHDYFKTRTLKAKLDMESDGGATDLLAAAKAKLAAKLKDRETVIGVKVLEDVRRVKVKARTTEGKTKTVYNIAKTNGYAGPHLPAVSYQTQAEARKAALAFAKEHGGSLTVTARKQRESGEVALAVVEATLIKRTVTAEVTIERAISGAPPVIGWLFCGWASS